MKLAITVSKERIAPLFDTARCVLLLELEDGDLTTSEELTLKADGGMFRVNALLGREADTVICGAISRDLSAALDTRGVVVHSFVSGDVDRVVTAFLTGTLHSGAYRMPGCGDRGPRFEGGGLAADTAFGIDKREQAILMANLVERPE